MDTINLDVIEKGYTNAKEARQSGRIPMAYYGKGVKNRHFSVDYQDFRRAYEKGGRSTVLQMTNEDGENLPVLVQEIQYEPVSDEMMHVDLTAVDLNKKIRTQVPIVLTGTAPAVKEMAGVLMHTKESVEVECLPKNLPHEIEVDISSLADFHASISVGDIVVPNGVVILDAAEINLATVSAPRAAIEEEEAAETTEGAGEGEGEGEKEGEAEEGQEG